MEKIKDDKLEKCVLCDYCRFSCPIFYATEKIKDSPKNKAIRLKKEIIDEEFFRCSLCGFSKMICPNDVDFEIVLQRQKLNELGYETIANKKMIENIRKYNNPYGKKD